MSQAESAGSISCQTTWRSAHLRATGALPSRPEYSSGTRLEHSSSCKSFFVFFLLLLLILDCFKLCIEIMSGPPRPHLWPRSPRTTNYGAMHSGRIDTCTALSQFSLIFFFRCPGREWSCVGAQEEKVFEFLCSRRKKKFVSKENVAHDTSNQYERSSRWGQDYFDRSLRCDLGCVT